MEQRFREVLKKKWGMCSTSCHSFANVPLGRFRSGFLQSGNLKVFAEVCIEGSIPGRRRGHVSNTLYLFRGTKPFTTATSILLGTFLGRHKNNKSPRRTP